MLGKEPKLQPPDLPPEVCHELEEAFSRKDRGKLAEICIRESLKKAPIIESVEAATEEEQSRLNAGVDYWVTFKGWGERTGVQQTVAEKNREYIMKKDSRYPRFVEKEGKTAPVVLCEPDHKTVRAIQQGINKLLLYRQEQGNFTKIDIASEEIVPQQAIAKIAAEIVRKYMEARPELRVRFERHLRQLFKIEEY